MTHEETVRTYQASLPKEKLFEVGDLVIYRPVGYWATKKYQQDNPDYKAITEQIGRVESIQTFGSRSGHPFRYSVVFDVAYRNFRGDLVFFLRRTPSPENLIPATQRDPDWVM